MGPPEKKLRRRAGYTLVELMIIVTIIGISVTAFAPSFARSMADRRVSTTARELIRIGRRARSDTFGYLRAHVLWIRPAAGRVQLLRGTNNSCSMSSWQSDATDCDLRTQAGKGLRCIEDLLVAGQGPIVLREQMLNGGWGSLQRALCYSPSGVVYWAQPASLGDVHTSLTDANTVAGGFLYGLYSDAPGSAAPGAAARIHRVLFPLGATPRGLR